MPPMIQAMQAGATTFWNFSRRVDPISSHLRDQVLIDRPGAGECIEEQQEEHDDRHQDDLRQHVETEEHDEQRRQRDQRHAVERDDDRPQNPRRQRRPAEHQAGQDAEHGTGHQSGDNLGQRRRDMNIEIALQPARPA